MTMTVCRKSGRKCNKWNERSNSICEWKNSTQTLTLLLRIFSLLYGRPSLKFCRFARQVRVQNSEATLGLHKSWYTDCSSSTQGSPAFYPVCLPSILLALVRISLHIVQVICGHCCALYASCGTIHGLAGSNFVHNVFIPRLPTATSISQLIQCRLLR